MNKDKLTKEIVEDLRASITTEDFFADTNEEDEDMLVGVEYGTLTLDEMAKIKEIVEKHDCYINYYYADTDASNNAMLMFSFSKRLDKEAILSNIKNDLILEFPNKYFYTTHQNNEHDLSLATRQTTFFMRELSRVVRVIEQNKCMFFHLTTLNEGGQSALEFVFTPLVN